MWCLRFFFLFFNILPLKQEKKANCQPSYDTQYTILCFVKNLQFRRSNSIEQLLSTDL